MLKNYALQCWRLASPAQQNGHKQQKLAACEEPHSMLQGKQSGRIWMRLDLDGHNALPAICISTAETESWRLQGGLGAEGARCKPDRKVMFSAQSNPNLPYIVDTTCSPARSAVRAARNYLWQGPRLCMAGRSAGRGRRGSKTCAATRGRN